MTKKRSGKSIPDSQRHTVHWQARIDPELAERMEAEMDRSGLNRQAVTERAFELWLAAREERR